MLHAHLYTAGLSTLTALTLTVDQSKQIYQIAQATQQCWSDQSLIGAMSYKQTRMWANAQPDGRPAEHRWRPLFNTAKFG